MTPHFGAERRLSAIAERYAAKPTSRHVSIAMSIPSTGWSWEWQEHSAPAQYFVASITKLFTVAVVL